jgi:hypothetical protein
MVHRLRRRACPYDRCSRGCLNETVHRRMYSALRRRLQPPPPPDSPPPAPESPPQQPQPVSLAHLSTKRLARLIQTDLGLKRRRTAGLAGRVAATVTGRVPPWAVETESDSDHDEPGIGSSGSSGPRDLPRPPEQPAADPQPVQATSADPPVPAQADPVPAITSEALLMLVHAVEEATQRVVAAPLPPEPVPPAAAVDPPVAAPEPLPTIVLPEFWL